MESNTKIFLSEDFIQYSSWIDNARKKEKTWEEIKYACKENEEGLKEFLKNQKENNFWTIDYETWYEFVEFKKDIFENSSPGYIGDPKKPIMATPTNEGSCWVKYKNKLINNPNYSTLSIERIEKTSQKILSQLEEVTAVDNPIRGMVIGNVQSGKTANMAGLIAMAADYGYNFFIVLTGTIDNLRKQTRDRLINDLNDENSSLVFNYLDNLNIKSEYPERLQDLQLGERSNKRYLNVCLKNSKRLQNLLDWLNADSQSKKQLKILLIDDEADQASVNTKNVDDYNEQTAISRYIKYIVFGKNRKDEVTSSYKCLNYIGYTATPYANLLNEAGDRTLYPKNFITVLKTPIEYFGPEEIFGVVGTNNGLNILNEIPKSNIEKINEDEKILEGSIPESLKEAIMWFICTVSVIRYWKLKMPISMLVHTSQKVGKHFDLARAIEKYLSNIEEDIFLKELEKLYIRETEKFSIRDFNNSLPEYSKENVVKDYPLFEELLLEIKKLLKYGITHIRFADDGQLTYNEGLHLCIDNCSINNNDYMMRIIYPDKKDPIIEKSPAFIIIGGTTLSRGLTLNGLTTSYFLRTTNQADTLMQMGRWFGYRKDYELLPRLWLSQESISRFRRLSKLDYDLREELASMETKGLSPREYAPRLNHFPDYRLLVLTARKKMQKAIEYECTFYNKNSQTTLFYRDDEIIKDNYELTYNFLDNLGPIDKSIICSLNNPFITKNTNAIMWFDVDYNKVLDYLANIKIPNQEATFSNIETLKEWYDKEYNEGYIKNFTVIAGSLATKKINDVTLNTSNITIHPVTRSSVENIDKVDNKYINLKVIATPSDRLMDIDCSNLSKYDIETLQTSKELSFKQKRIKYASNDTPLLIVYIIDKDSGKDEKTKAKTPLYTYNLKNHLVGYYIYIPYGQLDENPNYVTVKLNYENDEVEVPDDED